MHQKARDNLGLLYARQGDRERAFEMVKRSVGEAEARSRLAQFFPPAQPAVREEDTVTASFSPAATPDVAVHDGSSQPEIRSSESHGAARTRAIQFLIVRRRRRSGTATRANRRSKKTWPT